MTDDRQLQELFDTYFQIIYRLAQNRLYTYTGNSEEAQDVVQEVFLLAAQKDIHNHPNPGGWLVATTNNICMNYAKAAVYRNKKLHKTADNIANKNRQQLPYVLDATDDMTESVATRLTLKHALSPEDYLIVVEHYIYGRSLGDIASDMGISYVALRVRLHRIRLKLKKYFFDM